ncbi:MAG: nicotinamidase [Deltaproteobacteria bacterium]|nr:nicotinamidase [Deltaproteobacteria bacterium]
MDRSCCLLIVDVQVDFCPGGALAVKDGDLVVPVINEYVRLFGAAGCLIAATRDWHPAKTVHFGGGKWPPHCVQGTRGAEFHPGLRLPSNARVITKGTRPDEDSYSGFDGSDASGARLGDMLKKEGVGHVFIAGLATDYCVRATALDARKAGFKVTALIDAIKGVDVKPGDSKTAIIEMIEAGADTATFPDVKKAAGHGEACQ